MGITVIKSISRHLITILSLLLILRLDLNILLIALSLLHLSLQRFNLSLELINSFLLVFALDLQEFLVRWRLLGKHSLLSLFIVLGFLVSGGTLLDLLIVGDLNVLILVILSFLFILEFFVL